VWASWPVWAGAEDLSPTGIRSPDRPARSEALYRLSYPGLRFSPDAFMNISKRDFRLPPRNTALFWVITQRAVVIPYRRFGTTYRVPSS